MSRCEKIPSRERRERPVQQSGPSVRPFARSFRSCDPSLCSNCNNHHGMFRPDIFHREEGLYQSTGSVALLWAVETMKSTTTNHNHIGPDRFSAASMHDQKGGVKWSGVKLLMADGRWLMIHIIISHFSFVDLA